MVSFKLIFLLAVVAFLSVAASKVPERNCNGNDTTNANPGTHKEELIKPRYLHPNPKLTGCTLKALGG